MNRRCPIERLESRRLLARRRILDVAVDAVEKAEITRVAEFAPAPILSAADQPINLMIIGDSIASGISQTDIDIQNSRNGTSYPARDSFRTEIWDLIQSEFTTPPEVNFIGSSMYNSAGLPAAAKAHSAYRGFESGSFFPSKTDPEGTVNNSNADADGWGTFVVDIALVLLGTNDVFNGRAISSLEDDLQDIVGVLRNDNPDVKVLIGTLPPYASRQNSARIPDANDMIRDLVDADTGWAGSTASSPITIIDHYNGEGNNPAFNVSLHTVDDLHPNPAGEELLANNWWTGLFPILNDVVEPPPPPTVTLTGAAIANEGETKRYSFTTSDPGNDTFVLGSRSCGVNGSLSNLSFNSTTGAGSFDCAFPDGPASSIVSVRVADSDGTTSNTAAITVAVADVLPTVTFTTPVAVMSPAIYPNTNLEFETTTLVEGMAPLELVVTRSGASTVDPLTVRYSMAGSATNGQDYSYLSGNVIIPAGATSASIVLNLTQDTKPELVETVRITLDEDSSYRLVGNVSVEYMVWDDDTTNARSSIFSDSVETPSASFTAIMTGPDEKEARTVAVPFLVSGADAASRAATVDAAMLGNSQVGGPHARIVADRLTKESEVDAAVVQLSNIDNLLQADLEILLMRKIGQGISTGLELRVQTAG